MRRGMTLPARLVSPSSFSNESTTSSISWPANPNASSDPITTPRDPSNQPATIATTVTVSTEEKIWKAVNNPNGPANVLKAEKMLNKIENDAGTFSLL